MKHTFRCVVPLIFLLSLILFSNTSARFLHTKPGQKIFKLHESITTIGSFYDVMGMEDCGGGEDEECLKRRVLAIADAHLDYIYTQHHKP